MVTPTIKTPMPKCPSCIPQNERGGMPDFSRRTICTAPEPNTQNASQVPMPISQVNSPMSSGTPTANTTATAAMPQTRRAIWPGLAFFQLAQGPNPMRNTTGIMIGTNTLLK